MEKKEETIMYINQCRKLGFSDARIKNKLITRGFDNKLIEDAFSKLNAPKPNKTLMAIIIIVFALAVSLIVFRNYIIHAIVNEEQDCYVLLAQLLKEKKIDSPTWDFYASNSNESRFIHEKYGDYTLKEIAWEGHEYLTHYIGKENTFQMCNFNLITDVIILELQNISSFCVKSASGLDYRLQAGTMDENGKYITYLSAYALDGEFYKQNIWNKDCIFINIKDYSIKG
ncbi:MAG: hypothetical protein V1859_01420 [archaeon]